MPAGLFRPPPDRCANADRAGRQVRAGPSETGHVGLFGADRGGGVAKAGQLSVGQVALYHAADAHRADLRLHPEIHA